MLSPYRVLDLADGRGAYCGKVLADLGADVIKIEPPWGDPLRRIGPFFRDEPDMEHGIPWAFYSSGKKSVTLNVEESTGRDLFLKLVEDCHFIIESFRPGYMKSLGFDYESLKRSNPGLIMISITAFGQDGPYSQYASTDLIGMALSGMMYLSGDRDRPPVRVSEPQFWSVGATTGAAAAMIAHHHTMQTGIGQWSDVSCQQAVARTLSHAPMFWDIDKINLERQGPFRPVGRTRIRINWQCKDGYVNFIQPGGQTGGRSMGNLCTWMEEEGMGNDVLRNTNWGERGFGQLEPKLVEQMVPPLESFFLTKTKAELGQGAIDRRIILFPVNDPKDLYQYPQLQARDFFHNVEGPNYDIDGETFTMLGPFLKSSQGLMKRSQRAPKLGEHNQAIFENELKLEIKDIERLKTAKVI